MNQKIGADDELVRLRNWQAGSRQHVGDLRVETNSTSEKLVVLALIAEAKIG